eukprot:10234676-Alexandrium_andersonii.AAC.1
MQAERGGGMPPFRAARRAVCLKSDHEKLALVARRSNGRLLASTFNRSGADGKHINMYNTHDLRGSKRTQCRDLYTWDLCAAQDCHTEHSRARAPLRDWQRHLYTSACTEGALLHDSSPLP